MPVESRPFSSHASRSSWKRAGIARVGGHASVGIGRSGVVFRGSRGWVSAWDRRRQSESADDSAASGRDIQAPRTRADRGSRRAVNSRGSSVGSSEHSPGLSSSCTRPCQPSRRAGVRRRSGGEFTNCKVGTTIFCRERDERSVRRAGRALDDSRGCARCRSDEIEDPRGVALGVVRRDGADPPPRFLPPTKFSKCEKFLGRRELLRQPSFRRYRLGHTLSSL